MPSLIAEVAGNNKRTRPRTRLPRKSPWQATVTIKRRYAEEGLEEVLRHRTQVNR